MGPAANLALAFVGPWSRGSCTRPRTWKASCSTIFICCSCQCRGHQPVPHVLQPAAHLTACSLPPSRSSCRRSTCRSTTRYSSTRSHLPIVIVAVPYVFHFNPVSIYLNWTAGNVANLQVPIQHRIGRRRVVQGSHSTGAVRTVFCTWSAADIRRHLRHQYRRPVPGRVTHMQNLDLDVAEHFLLVASTLLEIKAESLLPRARRRGGRHRRGLAPNEARGGPPAHVQARMLPRRCSPGLRRKGACTSARSARRVLPEPHARLPQGCHVGRARAAVRLCSCANVWNRSTSLPSPSPWRRTCAPTSTQAHREQASTGAWWTSARPLLWWWSLLAVELYKRAMVKVEQKAAFGDTDIPLDRGFRSRGRTPSRRWGRTHERACRHAHAGRGEAVSTAGRVRRDACGGPAPRPRLLCGRGRVGHVFGFAGRPSRRARWRPCCS